MATKKPPAPRPIDGVVFERSAAKIFGFIVLNAVLFLFGVFLIWAKLTGQVLDRGSNEKQVTWWGLLLGVVAVLGAPAMTFRLVRSLWVRRRLVVGSDRLQVLEHLRGQDTVVVQIPFANIAEIKYEATKTDRRVGIDLVEIDDAKTYAPHENFRRNRQFEGRHYCISGGYEGGPRLIATAIKRAYNKWAAD